MASTDSPGAPSAGAWFVTTHWTVVLTAGRSDTPRAQAALAQLCETYWYPLYAYVRRRGYTAEDAEDLTQEFFARLLEKHSLEQITREGGKFRSFLLTTLNHFLVDEWKRAKAEKRGGGRVVSLDGHSAETRYQLEPVDPVTAEQIYERNWALALLDTVVNLVRRECDADGKADLFEQLKFCLTGERSALPYAELAGRLAMPEATVKTKVHRLRQRYRELLRAEVANTVTHPSEIEEELRHLLRVLAL